MFMVFVFMMFPFNAGRKDRTHCSIRNGVSEENDNVLTIYTLCCYSDRKI
jgi:hypothetical protein